MGWPRRWLYPVLPRRRDVSDCRRGRPQGQGLPHSRRRASHGRPRGRNPSILCPHTEEKAGKGTHPGPVKAAVSGVVGAGLPHHDFLPSRSSGVGQGPGMGVRHVP
jgi:hypothetical protein